MIAQTVRTQAHVKASVSVRISLVRLVQYSLIFSTVFLHFTEQNKMMMMKQNLIAESSGKVTIYKFRNDSAF